MDGRGTHLIRFGTFEACPSAAELRKSGRLVSLQEQPFRLLLVLLEHPGEVVPRSELREKLWGDTYVDFEEGLNTAIRKLRDALGDSASNPRFIETLPRRGYRFIAPVEVIGEPPSPGVAETGPPPLAEPPPTRRLWIAIAIGICVLTGAGFLARIWLAREPPVLIPSPPVQLTRDSGLTTDPAISRDGKLLVYASDRAGSGNLDIWVRHLAGGEPRRLTDDPADDYQPDISPDGSEVLFRSEREPRGIYSAPTLGGSVRLLIKDGFVPRYSPDGSQIAFSLGTSGSGGFTGTLHLYTRSTGSARTLAPGLMTAGAPAWSPDGKSLAFAGLSKFFGPLYLFLCPADGGAATRMSDRAISDDEELFLQVRTASVAWLRRQLIVSVKQGDASNLWAGGVSESSGRLNGELRRITVGSGNEILPSVSATGKLVFANHSYSAGIWEAALGPIGGATLRRLTQDRALNFRPSLSSDGLTLAYVSNRTGKFEAWMRDLTSGRETTVSRGPKAAIFAALSRDASQLAFWDDAGVVYLASTATGAPRFLCAKCGRPDDWTPDGKIIIAFFPGAAGEPEGIGQWDPRTGRSMRLTVHQTLNTTAPHLSPDGRWLTFHTAESTSKGLRITGKRQVFLMPYLERWTPPSEWVAVTDGQALDREPSWSADGNRIFFLSDRDGYRCIWARKLEPKTKQPVGQIYPVLHLHEAARSLLHIPNTGAVGLNSTPDKLIFSMGELTGNLWMTELSER